MVNNHSLNRGEPVKSKNKFDDEPRIHKTETKDKFRKYKKYAYDLISEDDDLHGVIDTDIWDDTNLA